MINYSIRTLTLALACISFAGCKAPENALNPSATTGKERSTVSSPEGFESDLERFRKTVWLEKPGLNASSAEALQAAHRIFANISFVGMKRDQVLQILGDPETISNYGKPMEKDPNSPLIYRFDTGFGGVEYAILFKHRRVAKVESRAID